MKFQTYKYILLYASLLVFANCKSQKGIGLKKVNTVNILSIKDSLKYSTDIGDFVYKYDLPKL
jgi:hypothetical protein